ncbi:MAG: hypothetical protein RBS43_01875 [Candidatus Cloacimonas sp.]|jgi:hypothetical protein|nr:hypothetical protein [Candidatus Cloacimonas sp.]
MKSTVKEGLKGFSGKLDGAIYYYHPRLKRTLMRRAPKMPIQPENIEYATIARQILRIISKDQSLYSGGDGTIVEKAVVISTQDRMLSVRA